MNVSKGELPLKQGSEIITRGRKRKLAALTSVQTESTDKAARIGESRKRPASSQHKQCSKSHLTCASCRGDVTSQNNQCSKSHLICGSCLKVAIRASIGASKTSLTCPAKKCKAEITLDESDSSFSVSLFRAFVRRMGSLEVTPVAQDWTELVSCPSCKTTTRLTEAQLTFKCSNGKCRKAVCRFCGTSSQKKHVGCKLLKFPGSSCWTDMSKLPANWSKFEDSEYKKAKGYIRVRVPLESEEGSSVVSFYRRSSTSVVKGLWRIQSPHLWQRYVLQKKHMLAELGLKDLHERPLFHGTHRNNKDKICLEGFDCRKANYNGLCGQGTYFSPRASYSEDYTVFEKKLFLAFVLCGMSTPRRGRCRYPPSDTAKRMYDSVTDKPNPNMYVVFCGSQCYPAYLITYK